jgi:apolipoprotein D and lipocalin family protein
MASVANADRLPLETVSNVDLVRYAGLWHQIAFLPTRFQKNCTIDTTATYTAREDGRIGVRNECSTPAGKRNSIEGYARVVDRSTNAKLKVKFFWFAPAGDYWVIDLDPNYEYAVVGAPNRKYLWVLSRKPNLDSATYSAIVERARQKGFDVSRLQITGTVTSGLAE